MKKIIISILVVVFTVGCAQAPMEPEKTVDPEVVEQPQEPNEAVKLEDLITIEKYEVKVAKRQKPFLNFESYTIETPILLLKSKEANDFNQTMREKTDGYINGIVYETEINEIESYVKEVQFFTVDVFQSAKILSIVCKEQPMLYNAGSALPIYSIYNFRIEDGKELTNDELFEMLEITEDKYQNFLDKELSKKYPVCEAIFVEPPTKECYRETPRSEFKQIGSSDYDENSLIYYETDILHTLIEIYVSTSSHIEDIRIQLDQ